MNLNSSANYYKHYTLLVVLFYTILFVNDVIVYKLVQIGTIQFSASSLIYPVTYLITDIIVEVYGYDITRKLIWQSMIVNIIFSSLIGFSLYLPSPTEWPLQNAFSEVFHNITSISVVHAIIAPLSYFVNAYLLSKWKIMTQGKYFWFRSVTASLIGELAFSIMMAAFIWHAHSIKFILVIVMATYATKLIWTMFGSCLTPMIVYYLKKSEQIDVFDYNTNFNPFKLKGNEKLI